MEEGRSAARAARVSRMRSQVRGTPPRPLGLRARKTPLSAAAMCDACTQPSHAFYGVYWGTAEREFQEVRTFLRSSNCSLNACAASERSCATPAKQNACSCGPPSPCPTWWGAQFATFYDLPTLSVKGCCHQLMAEGVPGFRVDLTRQTDREGLARVRLPPSLPPPLGLRTRTRTRHRT